jgi:hypothetical protein
MTKGHRMVLRRIIGRGQDFGRIYKTSPSSCHDPFGSVYVRINELITHTSTVRALL